MADDRGHQENAPLTPDEVSQHEFATTFRGYDPGEVRSFLDRVSGRLRALEELSRGLRGRLAQMQADARAGRQSAAAADAGPGVVDESLLLDALGEQAAHILRTAHEAADAVARRAEDEARQRAEVAERDANRIRLQAEANAAARIRDADAEAAVVVAQAQDDGERIRATARGEAAHIVEEGRHRGREIVEEAQGVRERVLGDLMKRRRIAQVQIEQLRAGRERLLEAYRVVRRTLDDVTDELQRADAEARAAAEAAGRRLAGEPGRSLPTLPSGPKAADSRAPEPRSGDSRPSEVVAKRTFAPRPEPPAPSARTRPAGAGPGPAAGGRVPRPEVRGRSEESRVFADPGALTESVRIIGRAGPGAVAPATGGDVDVDASAEVEAAGAAVDPFPAFPGMADAEAAVAGLDEALDAERALTDWSAGRRVPPAATTVAPTRAERPAPGPADGEEPVPPAPVVQDAVAVPVADELRESSEPSPEAEPVPEVEATEAGPGPAFETTQGAEADAAPAPAPQEAAGWGQEPVVVRAPTAEALEAGLPEARPIEEAATPPQREEPVRHGRPDLDQLFARIRSERAEAVARAHEVLDAPGSSGAAPDNGGNHQPTADPADVRPSGVGAGAGIGVVGDGDESALQERDRAMEPLLDALTRKLKRALQDEQNDLLDRLRNHRGRGAEGVLPTAQAQAERFRSAALSFLADAGAEGVAFYGGHVSEPIAVQDLADNLAFSIVGPLRRRLETAMADGQLDDAGTVAEHVGAAYREWKSQRIEQVAGDHAVAAFSRGVLAGASPRSTWRWVVDDQGTPCPDCDDNALAGAVPANESFPTGQLHPPAHTGCRCLLVPGP